MENYQLLLNLCSCDISMWALRMWREATMLASGEWTHTVHINNLKSPDVLLLELSYVKTVAIFPTSEGVKLQLHRFSHSGNAYPCWDDSAHLSCSGLAQLPAFSVAVNLTSEWLWVSEIWPLWTDNLGSFYRSGGKRASSTQISGLLWGPWNTYRD